MKLSNGYEIRRVILDGNPEIQLNCPGCGQWGFIDDDQYNGRVSIDCPDCEFHETHNLKSMQTKGHLLN